MASIDPSIRKLPFIGGTIYKIGQVYDLINTPCTVDPWLWVYGFWHEVPYIFAMLLLPDPVDTVQERFGRPHHRKRRYRGKVAAWKPADISPGKGLGWAAWRMTEWIDRVGWYLLIADTSVTFALNWTSLVYEWSGCRVPNKPYLIASSEAPFVIFDPGQWYPLDAGFVQRNFLVQDGLNGVLVPGGLAVSATCSAIAQPTTLFPGTGFELRVRDEAGRGVIMTSASKTNERGENVATVAIPQTPRIGDDRSVFFEVRPTAPVPTQIGKRRYQCYGATHVEGLVPWLGDVKL